MRFEGRSLGQYLLLRLIGRGGNGDVYLAEDQRIKRQVAVKIVQSELLKLEDAKETARLFDREARAIAMLNHPHILPLFDFGETTIDEKPILYLVTPFCADGSLAAWLQKRSTGSILSLAQAVPLIQQAADALAYAHDQGVVHRDVKPSNFLIRIGKVQPDQPDLLLADFGIARLMNSTIHASQTIRGTPSYMSPEQWAGTAALATDQYALAIMTYELLTGRPPFQGSQQQVMYQHCMTAPQPPSQMNPRVTAAIDAVLLRALAKQPKARFASITEYTLALQQAVEKQGPSESALSTHISIPPAETASHERGAFLPVQVRDVTPPAQLASDVHIQLNVNLTDAMQGVRQTIQLPNGQLLDVDIPPSARDGQKIRLEKSVEPSAPHLPKKDLIVQLTILPGIETPVVASIPGLPPSPLKSRILLPVALSLAIILASIIGIFSFNGTFTIHNAEQATATTNEATMQVLDGTYTAATATAQAQTTEAIDASATATVVYNPYDSNLKTLAVNETLAKNSSSAWDEKNGNCTFSTNGYDVVNQGQQPPVTACNAHTTQYSEVSVEVRMVLLKGSGGGILLYTDAATLYYFHISPDRIYTLQKCTNGRCRTLTGGYSSWIVPGQRQPNVLAIDKNNNQVSVYINKYYIDGANDTSSGRGQIGLEVESNSEAIFSGMRVWIA